MYCRLKPILYQSTALFSLFGNWLCLLFSSDRDIRAFDLNSDILKSANRSDERGETSAFKPSELPMSQPEYPLSLFELPLLLFYRCLHRRERRGSGDHCWVSRLQHPVHCWSLWAICRNGEFPFREKKSIHLSTLIYYNKRYHSCEIYIMQLFCTEIGKKIMQNS